MFKIHIFLNFRAFRFVIWDRNNRSQTEVRMGKHPQGLRREVARLLILCTLQRAAVRGSVSVGGSIVELPSSIVEFDLPSEYEFDRRSSELFVSRGTYSVCTRKRLINSPTNMISPVWREEGVFSTFFLIKTRK